MADNFLSGKSGSVMIGTVAYSFHDWSLAMKTDTPKISNFTSAPYHAYLAALTGATLKLSGPYNEGNCAFTSGTSYTFILGYTNSVNITVTAIISEITPKVDVEDAQRIEISGQVTGSFTAAIV